MITVPVTGTLEIDPTHLPPGPQGAPGPAGPPGPQGEAADIAYLEEQIIALEARITALEEGKEPPPPIEPPPAGVGVTRNIKTDYGAHGDGVEVTATLTITAGTPTLQAGTNLWNAGDVGKMIWVEGAGERGPDGSSSIGAPFVLKSMIDGVNGAGDQVTLHDNATRTLSSSSKLVAWGHDDWQAFADFRADHQDQTGVVLNIPASSGFYAIWNGGDDGTAFCSGIKQVHVIGDNGDSRPVLNGVACGVYVSVLGIGSIVGFARAGFPLTQALIQTATAGANFVTCLTHADASKFAAGDWVCLNAYEMQTFGFPSNPCFFEYLQVSDSNATTGVITFTTNIVDSRYLSTYPGFDMDINSGSANILLCGGGTRPSHWDTECIWESLTVVAVNYQLTAIGRDIRMIDCTIDVSVDPTVCKSFTVTNNIWTTSAEIDKFNDTVTIDGGDYRFFASQSSGCAHHFTISNLHVDKLEGTPQNITCNNCDIDELFLGSMGMVETAVFNNCTINTDIQFIAFAVHDVVACGGSISGGTITALHNRDQWAATCVPGNICMFASEDSNPSVFGPTFQILSHSGPNPSTIGDPFTITTTLTNTGWPTIPIGLVSILRCPLPSVRFMNCGGIVKAQDLSRWIAVGNPPDLPYLSFIRRDYTKTSITGLDATAFYLIGRVTSVIVNVLVPHTGSTTPLIFAPIDEKMVLSDGTFSGFYVPHFNLCVKGKRTITPSGVTSDVDGVITAGGLSGDTGLTFPDPYIWNWNLLRTGISADVSGETGGLSFYLEIITDQGVTTNAVAVV